MTHAGHRARRGAAPRRALTLIELLVAITILAILAALLLGAAARAGQKGREARTKRLVSQVHTQLMAHYEAFPSRRVELAPYTDNSLLRNRLFAATGIVPPPDLGAAGSGDPRIEALVRLAALRELVRSEVPDCWADVLGRGVQDPPLTVANMQSPTPRLLFLRRPPAIWATYGRAYDDLVGRNNTLTGVANTKADILANQGAELLYLVVTTATSDGEGRGLLHAADTADTDGDGAPELVDAWGKPLEFLRWAPGFESDAQLSFPGLVRLYNRAQASTTDGLTGDQAVYQALSEDHDPLDLYRMDNSLPNQSMLANNAAAARGWRLVPLVVSGGADEETGIRDVDTYFGLDPWATDVDSSASGDQRLGDVVNREATGDNIDNHLITAR